jgi:RimJ/RimL family protein N-acetyltransferase
VTDHDLFPETIETERLHLERLDRAVAVRELYRHANEDAPHIDEVTEYLPWQPHATMNDTREYLAMIADEWANADRAAYAIAPREDEPQGGEYAGNGDLSVDWDRRTGTLGTWLRKPFWGRGYSGERATALVALAFERLDLDLIAVTHQVGNENSRRAIETYVDRFGGRRDGTFRNFHAYRDGAVDAVRYTIPREGWRSNRPPSLNVRFE